jgi:Domain of unknown function (DUF4116)
MNTMTHEAAYAMILHDTKTFKFLPEEFRSDKEFIKKCLKLANFPTNLKLIAEHLKHDEEFVKELIQIKGLAFSYMGEEFHTKKEFILLAVEKEPFIFEVLDKEFQVYKNNLDLLRDEVNIEKLRDKLEISLEPVGKVFKTKKI